MEGLGINLVGKEYDSNMEDTNIETFLTEDIKNSKYELLGKEENAFVALPNPLTETRHEKSEFFPNNTDLEHTIESYLIAGFNQEAKKIEEFLLVFEQLKTGNFIFTDPRPKEEWVDILSGEENECQNCLFKSNKGHSVLSYGKWIIKDKKKYKVENVGLSNNSPMYLEPCPSDKYEKILELNKKSESTPSTNSNAIDTNTSQVHKKAA